MELGEEVDSSHLRPRTLGLPRPEAGRHGNMVPSIGHVKGGWVLSREFESRTNHKGARRLWLQLEPSESKFVALTASTIWKLEIRYAPHT